MLQPLISSTSLLYDLGRPNLNGKVSNSWESAQDMTTWRHLNYLRPLASSFLCPCPNPAPLGPCTSVQPPSLQILLLFTHSAKMPALEERCWKEHHTGYWGSLCRKFWGPSTQRMLQKGALVLCGHVPLIPCTVTPSRRGQLEEARRRHWKVQDPSWPGYSSGTGYHRWYRVSSDHQSRIK